MVLAQACCEDNVMCRNAAHSLLLYHAFVTNSMRKHGFRDPAFQLTNSCIRWPGTICENSSSLAQFS